MPDTSYATLADALLVLLCARWTQADELVADLRDFDGAKRIAFRWTPGQRSKRPSTPPSPPSGRPVGMTPERREYIRKVRNCVPLVNCDSGAGVPETQQAFDELLQSHDALAAQLAERDQTIAGLREWRAFLMSAGDSLWLTFGADAVEAAKALPVAEEAVSVSGTFDCRTPIDLRRNLWPYFTAWPRVTRSLPLPSPPAAEGE